MWCLLLVDASQFASINRASPRQLPLLLGKSLDRAWPVVDAGVVIVISVLAGLTYHAIAYEQAGDILGYAKVGAVVALFRLILQSTHIPTRFNGSWRYQLYLWNVAFLCLLAFGFLFKVSDTYSRGTILLFYVSGLPLLILWQILWKGFVRHGLSTGRLALRRGLLLGTREKIDEFRQKYRPHEVGMIISEVVVVRQETLKGSPSDNTRFKEAVARAVEVVRECPVDDVIVLLPWSATHAVNVCADKLSTIPASVQLGPEAIFDRFNQVHLSRLGTATMLNLIGPPLTRFQVVTKRAFDLLGALALLIATSPLLMTVALLIKLDSSGPVFFTQWRLGFNQRPFRILKFRTMTVAEDGDVVAQAVKGDPRITRVGRYLRRWNIDELPQLVNVLRGDMSLVGPRPHAIAHDRDFEKRIAFYARRHNIKPGITGWAQVNGWRGLTDTELKAQARVSHDLHYIDNWSLGFDIYILALTVLSPTSFTNAG